MTLKNNNDGRLLGKRSGFLYIVLCIVPSWIFQIFFSVRSFLFYLENKQFTEIPTNVLGIYRQTRKTTCSNIPNSTCESQSPLNCSPLEYPPEPRRLWYEGKMVAFVSFLKSMLLYLSNLQSVIPNGLMGDGLPTAARETFAEQRTAAISRQS